MFVEFVVVEWCMPFSVNGISRDSDDDTIGVPQIGSAQDDLLSGVMFPIGGVSLM